MDRVDEVVAKIKEKKELSSLDDSYVREHVETAMDDEARKKLAHARDAEQFFRSKEFDEVRSAVRKRLRETYGVFSHEHESKQELLTKLVNEKDQERTIRQLLSTHQSTRERLPFYRKLYKELYAITGCPARLLDLGCGLNPVSQPFMECDARIVACDISSADMEFLNTYFETMGIDGKAYAVDALDDERLDEIIKKEQPALILMLKLADTLETLKRHSSKKLIARLIQQTDWIAVSFATVSLGGGKKIRDEKRTWFEKFIEREGYEKHEIRLPNEKVYVLTSRHASLRTSP